MASTRRQIFAMAFAPAALHAPRGKGAAQAAEGGENDPRWADDPRLAQLWRCTFRECPGYIYDPLLGEERQGIPPRTAFQDLPDDFQCPKCGSGKRFFRKDVNRAEL
jgi:rubredoxin